MSDLRRKLRLYLVTDPKLCAPLGIIETVRRAVVGGVSMVQLRDKTATTRERIAVAREVKLALAGRGVPVVINDDVAAAVAADVDGAHIGQGDMTPAEARAQLGPDRILGLSCETADAVRAADPAVVDYLGLGPVFGTATKPDHVAPIGWEGLGHLVALTPLPSVAIGGLKADHRQAARDAGADGVAVVSAICGQPDVTAAARAFGTGGTNQ
ncbi:thiamine phosphate synthase [Marivita sp. GX14005]|uniref:thiamine phosphate synthase n=1 Tax=Marivita sp. GX14005 TaxID=2942276 RepID=UPI002019683A|nr:thiamine phosphate synthase [Marivita sp. GX14005]MCL3881216.1 thiamine phosphate synthase [Marivita sp. GX14005]